MAKEKVGVLGLGLMGSAFATNLLSRGYEVHVYNRTQGRADPLAGKGAVLHASPGDLSSAVDAVMTSFTDHRAVEDVALGKDGFLAAMSKGALWVDTSTTDPDASVLHGREA